MTHSLVICKETDYNDWVAGKFMFKYDGRKFLPNAKALKANGKTLRKTVKFINKDIDINGGNVGHWTKLLNKLTEENIKNYEEGINKAKKFEFYTYYDFEDYYITFEEWQDYVFHYLQMCDIKTSDEVDGTKVVTFGYYGHD